MEGIIPLIIIGIVLNMIIKAVRAKTTQPAPKKPAPRPDLGQDVDRPFEDRPQSQVPHTPITPQPPPQVSDVRPVAQKRDLTKGVSMEGTSLEGTSMETAHVARTSPDTIDEVMSTVQAASPPSGHPIGEWFRGSGVVRGIIMSEVLNPPVSRRR